jgi:hypothetical protein
MYGFGHAAGFGELPRHVGLDGLLGDEDSETIADCNTWAYWIDPDCWSYSPSAWGQMAQLNPPVGASAPIPAPVLNSDGTTNQTPQDISNEQILASQAQNQAIADAQAPITATASTQASAVLMWGGLAVAAIVIIVLAGKS